MRSLLIVLMLGSLSAFGKQVEGIDFANEIAVNGKKLVLNGAGLRVKRKFGLNFRVYVGSLYLKEKTQDAKAIIGSPEQKVLGLVFLRSVDAATLKEAWSEGFEKNCAPDCEKAREEFKKFNDLMVDVKDQSRMQLTFSGQDVDVEVRGSKISSGKVSGEAIRKALMAIFIGNEPPTEDLKKALLGQI